MKVPETAGVGDPERDLCWVRWKVRELPQAEVAAETMGTDPDTGKENASRLCPEVTNLPATRFYHAALSAGGNSGFNTAGSLAAAFSAFWGCFLCISPPKN